MCNVALNFALRRTRLKGELVLGACLSRLGGAARAGSLEESMSTGSSK
jgi:hypothetical protein